MADMNSKSRKIPMNLCLFSSPETPAKSSIKSPKNFEEPNGVVGLGILAAMHSNSNDEYCSQDPFFNRTAILANSLRSLSNPIPILSRRRSSSFSAKSNKNTTDTKGRMDVEEMELCEGYTCVISHIGENKIKKKEYFDNGWFVGCSTNTVVARPEKISADSNSIGHRVSSRVVSASSAVSISRSGETPAFPVLDFLNSCFLCKKQLHGLDIFMYRGDRAFCSAECRGKQISMDEHRDKCVSGTMKPHEYSESPCSSPMQFFAGLAAA